MHTIQPLARTDDTDVHLYGIYNRGNRHLVFLATPEQARKYAKEHNLSYSVPLEDPPASHFNDIPTRNPDLHRFIQWQGLLKYKGSQHDPS